MALSSHLPLSHVEITVKWEPSVHVGKDATSTSPLHRGNPLPDHAFCHSHIISLMVELKWPYLPSPSSASIPTNEIETRPKHTSCFTYSSSDCDTEYVPRPLALASFNAQLTSSTVPKMSTSRRICFCAPSSPLVSSSVPPSSCQIQHTSTFLWPTFKCSKHSHQSPSF